MTEPVLKEEKSYKKSLEAYEKALGLFSKREYAKAKKLFEEILASELEETELLEKSEVYVKICDNHTTVQKPELKGWEDYYQHGIYLMNRGELDEAAKVLEKAHGLSKGKVEVEYICACLAALQGKREDALKRLEKVVSGDPLYKVYARTNPDFYPFVEDESFQKLLASEEEKKDGSAQA